MTPEVWQPFEGQLVQKLKALHQLGALAERHREALITRNVDQLVAINEEQTEQLSQLDRLQRTSSKLLSRVFAATVGTDEPPTLLKLAAVLPDEQRTRLEDLSSQLTDSAAQLAAASETNARLSATALDFIRFTLSTVSQSIADTRPAGANNALVLDAQV